jgi:DNA-binding Lrp family transcriptional regulator
MSSETVIRALKKFHADGIIRTYGKCIEVIDYERLKQISERG